MTLEEFLVEVPPNVFQNINDPFDVFFDSANHRYITLNRKEIKLYCPECNNLTFFRPQQEPKYHEFIPDFIFKGIQPEESDFIVDYRCSNCEISIKQYVLKIIKKDKLYKVIKFGEIPTFGPPIPEKLKKIFGEDKELFIKGQRAENQGLGIGALSYYRRVVENQRNKIIDKLIDVLDLGDEPDKENKLKILQNAKLDKRFSDSIDKIKDAFPKSLFIQEQNPFKLLYSPLSEGLHGKSDEECLEWATHIRIILTEFINRMNAILEKNSELANSIKKLTNRNNKGAQS